MAGPGTTIAREEFYRLLWSTPLKELVVQFGTTYDDILRLAREENVPRPPKGFWTNRATENAESRPPLKPAWDGKPRTVFIPSRQDERRERAELRAQLEKKFTNVALPQRLTRPHPLVSNWIAERREGKRSYHQSERLPPTYLVYGECDFRRHRFLHVLFGMLERLGARISGERDEQEVVASFQEANVKLRMREKLHKVYRPLTAQERRYSWNAGNTHTSGLDQTGLLSFEINTYTDLGRPLWTDSSATKIEERLLDIVTMIVMVQDREAQEERERAERHAREQQLRAIREAETARRRLEEGRWAVFVDLSRRSAEAEQARRLLDRLREAPLPPDQQFGDRSVSEWLEWAHSEVKRRDPVAGDGTAALQDLAAAKPVRPG